MGFFTEEAGIVTAVSSAIAVKITFLILPCFLSVIVVLLFIVCKDSIFCWKLFMFSGLFLLLVWFILC